MTPKIVRVVLSFVLAALVYYFEGTLVAILALGILPNSLIYVIPDRGTRVRDNGKVLLVALASLGLLLAAEFLAGTKVLRLSLMSAAVALMVLLAFSPLLPMVRHFRGMKVQEPSKL